MKFFHDFFRIPRVKLALLVLAATLAGIVVIRFGSEHLLGIHIDPDQGLHQVGPAFVGMVMMAWSLLGLSCFFIVLRFAYPRTLEEEVELD